MSPSLPLAFHPNVPRRPLQPVAALSDAFQTGYFLRSSRYAFCVSILPRREMVSSTGHACPFLQTKKVPAVSLLYRVCICLRFPG